MNHMKSCNCTGSLKNKMVRILAVLVMLAVIIISLVLLIDQYVQRTSSGYIVGPDETPEADTILVPGAYVFPDGTVSFMLYDRLCEAHELYGRGKAGKILVSGDHGRKNYDEVNTMKKFLLDKNVPAENVFMDHAGFSTYESIYRARDIFLVKKVIIVTQEYHLKRAIFIARELGLEAYGVASDQHDYGEVMTIYKLREVVARNKDFFLAKFLKPQPTFLGETIPVTGDGRSTDDQ
ncbi:MAG: vancomycin high temperature exclusion protein [Pelotomaculum sp. PtaB.Bin104]|nr:MAG: vancomycin high temperature exclusion protein [Pelotomaculum sp. PtaB.Bin104]